MFSSVRFLFYTVTLYTILTTGMTRVIQQGLAKTEIPPAVGAGERASERNRDFVTVINAY
jgi:hypothetical protein